jgi:hypothetical protein
VITIIKNIKTGTIRFNILPYKVKINGGWYYYDENYKLIYKEIGLLKEALALTLPSSSISVSLVIDFPNSNDGFATTEEITTPNFNITLTYKP